MNDIFGDYAQRSKRFSVDYSLIIFIVLRTIKNLRSEDFDSTNTKTHYLISKRWFHI